MRKHVHLPLWAALFSLTFPGVVDAADTVLADAPLAVTNLAKPNVMFIIDNSGGVDVDVLLPTFNSLYIESPVPPSTTAWNNTNGFFYLFPNASPYNTSLGSYPSLGPRSEGAYMMVAPTSAASYDPLAWRAYNYQYNKVYYNPYITYKPWAGKDNQGNAFANATPTAIKLDPYFATGATYDITAIKTYTGVTYLNSSGNCAVTNCPFSSGRVSKSNQQMYPAIYYMWNDANHNGVMEAGEGVLYQIKTTTPSYPSGRTYAAELQNFANWFQYYRTPFLSLKGAMGTALNIMASARVGVTDLDHAAPISPVLDLSVSTNLANMQNAVYGIPATPGDWGQPMHERLQNVWNYLNTAAGSTNPVPPIQSACQQNFSILVSPGYLNEQSPWQNSHTSATPTAIPSPTNADNALGKPYADGASDTLADWAAYYYSKQLRPDLTAGKVPLPANTHETNTNLHMTTYVLAPGAVPVLSSTPAYANPQTVDLYSAPNNLIAWPTPCYVCQNTIDDMWHAAVNGRGTFVNSTDIAAGLGSILDDILGRTGAAAAVAVNNVNVVATNNASYVSSYLGGAWTGDLQSYPIDLTTGTILTATPRWTTSAQAQLDALDPPNPINSWWSTRAVGTYNGSAGIPFKWTSLSTTMQATLNTPLTPPGPTDGANVLAYLRGDRTNESTLYRMRSHMLGDIVNSEPVVETPPHSGYIDSGYAAYLSAKASRPTVVYQAANDGMVHAFDGSTGAEAWAYVPGLLFNNKLASNPSTSVLANLSFKTGFKHLYYVDATPAIGDVNFSATSGGGAGTGWHTILVGGLGKGGTGVYALDVSDPLSHAGATIADSDVASKVLWEYPKSGTPNAGNIGLVFGKPIIVKTKATGWVVLVASGYNNGTSNGGDGLGHLLVLDPVTGALLKDLTTSAGSGANPSGLAYISAYAANSDIDNTTDAVYGGDLLGNVWRFNLGGTSMTSWSVTKLAALVDGSGVAQPITSAPEIATYNGKRFIYVGTGQYLNTSDITSTSKQTMYGLMDDLSTAPLIYPLRANLQAQTMSSGTNRTVTSTALGATAKGWYVDLPSSGERVVSDSTLAMGALVFTSIVPSTDPCVPGGSSYEYFLDYKTGGAIPNSTVSWSGQYLGDKLASRPTIIETPNGRLESLVRKSDATNDTTEVPVRPQSGSAKRVYWREVLTQ